MIFVDTSAWFSAFVPDDINYVVASVWYRDNQSLLITTDYVIDELLTLLISRRERSIAVTLGRLLFEERAASIEWLSQSDVRQAWSIFEKYQDKGWSFTDCTSYAVMKRLGITQAFAFDDHFRQFGNIAIVP